MHKQLVGQPFCREGDEGIYVISGLLETQLDSEFLPALQHFKAGNFEDGLL